MFLNHVLRLLVKYLVVQSREQVLCSVLGEPVPRSLEGLFVYEERSASAPANDSIVVEQWTVIEVSPDRGPELQDGPELQSHVKDQRWGGLTL